MFVVNLTYLGNPFYLRNTVWTSDPARASKYTTELEARAALTKAKPFMKATQFKAAYITREE